jgi:hypothetical protein
MLIKSGNVTSSSVDVSPKNVSTAGENKKLVFLFPAILFTLAQTNKQGTHNSRFIAMFAK